MENKYIALTAQEAHKEIGELIRSLPATKYSGRTTRLCDWYIQELFLTGFIKVEDHYAPKTPKLYLRIVKRLALEHKFVAFEYDIKNYCIRINPLEKLNP